MLIEFAAGTSIHRERPLVSQLPIVGNGPPGTFVLVGDRLRVSLPTDQIVFTDDTDGRATVAFGGMRFAGVEEGQLIFVRERELHPEEQLSPARSHTMILNPRWVSSVLDSGRPVWPVRSADSTA